jgi:2-polyprenyl-6-hydroxyphenyl methylase/3-demethylubiquinone-9 3-methyltransferase
MINSDIHELEKFNALAADWWDANGSSKALHDINPLRLQFILDTLSLQNQKVLDVGCGGGILSEALALSGAEVTGIDLAEDALKAAVNHLTQSGLAIHYLKISAEELAITENEWFDVITCMEMLEHVPDPQAVINACAKLLKPNGYLFCATINRNIKAYLQAVIGAEYILRLIPKGTHDYDKLIRPSELSNWCRKSDLSLKKLMGMTYNPLSQKYKLTNNISVNYLALYQKET